MSRVSRLRVGVLASGRGSNLQAIVDQARAGQLMADVVIVCSNRADAPALARAHEAGISVFVADRASVARRKDRQRLVSEALVAAGVELVVLAGFTEILVPEFVSAWRGRIINTHPSLLPAFGGTLHAVEAALEHGVRVTGCTIHLVTDELDAGPILFQAAVDVEPDDDAESLHARIRQVEHRLLPAAIQAFAEKRIELNGSRARVLPSATDYAASAT
jgi:phosphoribosylglycinamide formyltransferase 1